MYYPYLRGKQFELLALREFAESYSDNCRVFPVIEPVRTSFNSMRIALKKLQEKEIHFALILNPQVGDLSIEGNQIDIEIELQEILSDLDSWIPAFIVNNSNFLALSRYINGKNYQHIMLICEDSIDINNSQLKDLIELNQVKKVVFTDNNRSFKRYLNGLGKETIRIDDNFKPQKRNSDYCNIPEEKFSEEVFYFREDNFTGIMDYTVLNSTFVDVGMLPRTLAIHLTYKKNNNEIWVRHFVSDTNDDNTNIQGKFEEAAAKAIEFFEAIPYTNDSINDLTKYYESDQYPGLGVIKKISVKNHLELMNSILTSI
jgi:hypothetical protein